MSAHHNHGKGRGTPAHRLHACPAFYLYGLLGQLTGKLIGGWRGDVVSRTFMHLLLVGLGPSLSHGRAYSELQDAPVSIPKLSYLATNETSQSGHFFRWSPLATGIAVLFFFLYRYGVNLFRLQLTLKFSLLVSKYMEGASKPHKKLFDCFNGCDLNPLRYPSPTCSELIHHKQNIPGTHSPSESKIVPGSQGALSPCILLYSTWFLLEGPPILTKLASPCTKKLHSLSMGLVCLIIWWRAASILWRRSKTSCINSMKTTKIVSPFSSLFPVSFQRTLTLFNLKRLQ